MASETEFLGVAGDGKRISALKASLYARFTSTSFESVRKASLLACGYLAEGNATEGSRVFGLIARIDSNKRSPWLWTHAAAARQALKQLERPVPEYNDYELSQIRAQRTAPIAGVKLLIGRERQDFGRYLAMKSSWNDCAYAAGALVVTALFFLEMALDESEELGLEQLQRDGLEALGRIMRA